MAVGHTPEHASAARPVAACAREMQADAHQVSAAIGARVLQALPALGATEHLRRAFDASLSGNVVTALTLLETGAEPDQVPLSQPQLDFAELVTRERDVGLDDVLGAYRLGQSAFLACWTGRVATSVSGASDLAAVVESSSSVLDTYISRSAARVAEKLRGPGRASARDWAAERARLSHVLESTDEAVHEVGSYALDARHLGIVLQHPDGLADPDAVLDACCAALLRATQAQDTYGLVLEDGTVAIWVRDARNVGRSPVQRALERALPPRSAAALGRPGAGVRGFRATHRQALRAGRLGLAGPEVVRWYDDVELAVLLSADPDAADHYVQHHLGPLAEREEAARRLRMTLRIFLEEQGNARRAAERLFLHRNSVLYRIKSIQQLLDRDLLSQSLELRVALHLADLSS